MLIFVALIKKREADSENQNQQIVSEKGILTEIEQSSGFRIEQYTNFNIQMIFSSDSYLLLLRQDKDLCPIKICNELKHTVLLIS